MKLTKLFSKLWLSAAALLAFSACSNEDLPTQTASEAPKTKKVRVEFTTTKSEESIRSVFGVDTSNEYGRIKDLQMSEKDVVLRVSVRRGDSDLDPLTVQDIVFKKAPGRNYATYAGEISVPTTGTGNYKIAAILLREVDGEVYFKPDLDATVTPITDFSQSGIVQQDGGLVHSNLTPQQVTDGKVSLNVPYITKWQDLVVSGTTAESTTLYLEPQGTILRMRIRNDATVAKTFHRMKLVTNAFVRLGTYVLSNQNGYPKWYTRNGETYHFNVPNGGVSVEGNGAHSPWYYFWVMPRKLEQVDRKTVGSLSLVAGSLNISDYKVGFFTDKQLPTGSVAMTFVYNDGHDATFDTPGDVDGEWGASTELPKMAIEYISEYPLNKTATAFVNDVKYDNPQIGYFSYDEKFKGTQYDMANVTLSTPINGVKWHVPSRNELASIFPQGFDLSGYGDRKFAAGVASYNVLESNVQIGALTQDFSADYQMTGTALYAIRFKSKTNRHRTAFRYQTIGTTANKDKRLRIECVYLGDENITLAEVAQESFWTSRSGAIKSREFANVGWLQPSGDFQRLGESGGAVSSTQYDETTYYTVLSYSNYGYITSASVGNRLPVYPFRTF